MSYLYELVDDQGTRIELRAYDAPQTVGAGAPGEFARMRLIPSLPPSWPQYQAQALMLLQKSDETVLRCTEAGIALPASWRDYRRALRSIVGAVSGDATGPLPARPAYPAGT